MFVVSLITGTVATPTEVLEDGSGLFVKLFHFFVRMRDVAQSIKLWTKLRRNGRRKGWKQQVYDPVLPDIVVRPQGMPDVRYKRCTDRREEWRQDMSDGPVVVLKPLDQFAKNWINRRIARINCGLRALQVHLASGVRGFDEGSWLEFSSSPVPCPLPRVL